VTQIDHRSPASKIRRPIHWLWFDWAIFVVFAWIVVISSVRPIVAFPWWMRLLLLAAMGGALVAAYHFTLHQLWVRLVPGWYRKWLCSQCGQRVTRKATRCPRCGSVFH
jgi:hypothetical protein